MLEPFIASPIMAIIGYLISIGLQHFLKTTYWTIWIPFLLFSLPFIFFYLIVIPILIFKGIKEKLNHNKNNS